MTTRRPYAAPALSGYGSVCGLTRLGAEPNADTPGGADGSAYSP